MPCHQFDDYRNKPSIIKRKVAIQTNFVVGFSELLNLFLTIIEMFFNLLMDCLQKYKSIKALYSGHIKHLNTLLLIKIKLYPTTLQLWILFLKTLFLNLLGIHKDYQTQKVQFAFKYENYKAINPYFIRFKAKLWVLLHFKITL